MNTFKEVAIEVLKKAGEPLHYKEITRLVLEEGILETQGSTPDQTMYAIIYNDVKYKKESSDFIKTARSVFGLNPSRKELPQQKIIEEKEKAEEDKIKIESGFVGKVKI